MTWKEYEASLLALSGDWAKLEEFSASGWTQGQLLLLKPFVERTMQLQAQRMVEQAGSSLLEPAVATLKRLLHSIVEMAEGPEFDTVRWSASIEFAAKSVRQFVSAVEATPDLGPADAVPSPDTILRTVTAFCDRLTNNIRKACDLASRAVALHGGHELGGLALRIREMQDEAQQKHDATLRHCDEVNRKTSELLSTAVLTSEARWFDNAQRSFAHQSEDWLTRLIVSASLLAMVFTFFIFSPPALKHGGESWSVAGNLAHFGPRVGIVSLLSTLVLVCVREYRAARHNHVVNLHRASTVSTVKALTKQGEGRLNEAILTLAAQSVFTPSTTGFDKSGPGGALVMPTWLSELKKSGASDDAS